MWAGGGENSQHRLLLPTRVFIHPDDLVYNTTGLENVCPISFVIPDNPLDPDVEWVNGTLCAVGCLSSATARDDFYDGQMLIDCLAFLGFVGIAINIASYRVARKRVNYLTFYTMLFPMFGAVFNILTSFQDVESRFCRDNATALTSKDGLTVCSATAVVSIYTTMGTILCWGFQSAHLFNLIVLEVKKHPRTHAPIEMLTRIAMLGKPLLLIMTMPIHAFDLLTLIWLT